MHWWQKKLTGVSLNWTIFVRGFQVLLSKYCISAPVYEFKPNSPPGVAIVAVFGGDQFVDMFWEQDGNYHI